MKGGPGRRGHCGPAGSAEGWPSLTPGPGHGSTIQCAIAAFFGGLLFSVQRVEATVQSRKGIWAFGRFGKTLSRAAPKTSRSSDAAGLARAALQQHNSRRVRAALTMRCAILLALAVAAVDARGGGGGGGRNNGAQTPDVSLLQVRYA